MNISSYGIIDRMACGLKEIRSPWSQSENNNMYVILFLALNLEPIDKLQM